MAYIGPPARSRASALGAGEGNLVRVRVSPPAPAPDGSPPPRHGVRTTDGGPLCVVTATQHEALEALARCGSIKAAAHDLGLTPTAVTHRLRKVRKRTGMTTIQLVHRLGQGRVSVQDGFWLDAA